MEVAAFRKSWAVFWVGVILAFVLSGCETLFPKPAYTPPPAPVAPPPAPAPPQIARVTLFVAGNRLNLRACPGMDCPRIAILDRNEEVEKVGEAGDWAQIRVKRDGTIGWVNSRFLSASPVAAPPPEIAPAPAPAPQITPPPLPEIPETVTPAPAKPPAVEKPPLRPEESITPAIKRKPEEMKPVRPAKPAPPVEEEPEEVEQPKPVKPAKKPAPAPPEEKPAAPEKPASPAEPAPEKPSGIRIM